MSENRAFPLVVMAEASSEEEAWEVYDREIEFALKFINGYTYWRSLPVINKEGDFASGETIYRVFSRIFSVLEPLDGGALPINLDEPYPKITGFETIETTVG